MLLGCRFAHPLQTGAIFIRPDESQDNRLAEPRQPKISRPGRLQATHDDVMALRALDLSSLRIAGIPQQIFDEFFISCRPKNARERSPGPCEQDLATQTTPVGLYLRTEIPTLLIGVPQRLVRCSPGVNARQLD